MGMCLDSTPEMGEYSVEVRNESFVIHGENTFDGKEKYHAFYLYPDPYPDGKQGSVEILLADIPKLRALLDEVEKYVKTRFKGE